MAFSLETWKQQTRQKLHQTKQWLRRRRDQDAPALVYGYLCSMALWPLATAAQGGELLPVMMALGSVAGGVGGNLLAEQIQRWQDRAENVAEEALADWVADNAGDNTALRQALDDILDQLEVIEQAQGGLDKADRQWFSQALQAELARLGNLTRFEAQLSGQGVITQDSDLDGGDRAIIGSQVQGDAFTGDDSRKVQAETYIERQTVYQDRSGGDPDQARRRYLERLRNHCQALPLAALGGQEGADEELTLDAVYIDLDTTTHIPGAAEEAAAGKNRLDPDERPEERPLTALEAAGQAPRLALLGGPGAGKSTFARKLLVWLAAANLGEVAPPPGVEAGLLPLLITLRDLAPRLADLDLTALSAEAQTQRLAGAVQAQAAADLARSSVEDFAEGLRQTLADGRCLLVLDGLDEVPPAARPLTPGPPGRGGCAAGLPGGAGDRHLPDALLRRGGGSARLSGADAGAF